MRAMSRIRAPLGGLFAAPFMRRIGFHIRRVTGGLDRHFFLSLLIPVIGFVVVAAVVVTLAEDEKRTFGGFGRSLYWAVTTVIGSGDPSYVSTAIGYVIGWLLAFFGVAIVAAMTGAVVGFVIDILLKEGQGMGAAGFRDHIVVCGWNSTARELIEELHGDEFHAKVVVLHESERNPAGSGTYFVRGDTTSAEDLERAGIREAASAVVFPSEPTNEADMRSILTVMAIEAVAPEVRTVVEVNNPAHVEHMQRARADEVLVTSRLASRLLARSALYPGLTEIMADIVSGGHGSELYRVKLPDAYLGLSIDDVATRLRGDHRATLLAVTRNGRPSINPPADFKLEAGDDAVVVAESLGTLAPLRLQHEEMAPLAADA